jgi:hypothetical protein
LSNIDKKGRRGDAAHEKLLVSLGLILVPVLVAAYDGDPQHLLPKKLVTLHATLGAYDACFAVAKILGVNMFYRAGLKSDLIKWDFDGVTPTEAFNKITAINHTVWEARPDFAKPDQVLVIVSEPASVR